MKLGRISVEFGYVVDLDNADMVTHAKEAILEDMSQSLGFESELPADNCISFNIKGNDGLLNREDIPEFLQVVECEGCGSSYYPDELEDGSCVNCRMDEVK